MTRFRSQTRIVDPSADIQGQMGLMNSLESQLSSAFIEMNLLIETTSQSDPRVDQAQRRIKVIQALLEEERQKFGMGQTSASGDERDYSSLVGEFERLMVDRQYAEKSYLAAQAAVDTGRAEAQRQSRYLATYAEPALPESVQYPKRYTLMLVITTFLILGWSVGVLVYYGIRDRR
jgi:capsular polysaccharide transport system permease protein